MLLSCPFSLGSDDPTWLRWIDQRAKSRNEWPTVDEFLIQFGIPQGEASRLRAIGLVSMRVDRVRLTTNGLRIAGNADTDLATLRKLLSAMKLHWRTTRSNARASQLAKSVDVDPNAAARLLSMAPVGHGHAPGQFADELLLSEESAQLDPDALTTTDWVPSPPTSSPDLLVQIAHATRPLSPAVRFPVQLHPTFGDTRSVTVGSSLHARTLQKGFLSGVRFSRLDARHATLDRIDLSLTRFEDCDFSGATFRGVHAAQTSFERCFFVGARFSASALGSAHFVDCVFDETSASDVLPLAHWNRAQVGATVFTPQSWAARGADAPTTPGSPTADSNKNAFRFDLEDQRSQVMVIFDGETIGALSAKKVSTKTLVELVRLRGQTLPVLDVESLVAGHEIRPLSADKDTYVRMARSLGIERMPAGEPSASAWSLLRRLDVLRRPAESGRPRKKGATSVEDEAAAIVAALEDAAYVPSKQAGDPIAKCSNRIRQRLKTAIADVSALDDAAAAYLDEHLEQKLETVAFTGGES